MYLCLLNLNPLSRRVHRDVHDVARMHQRIMGAFPQAPAGASARAHYKVLHRLEVNRRTSQIRLYVQSRERPRWEVLPADYVLGEGAEAIGIKEVGAAYEFIDEQRMFRFRLRANPTRKIDTKSGPDGRRRHGRRVPVRGEQAQVEWLSRQGERNGFSLVHVAIDASGISELFRSRTTGRTFQGVLYEGLLIVRDKDTFQQALVDGFGPAKAFGFGMLSLASQ